MINAFKEDFLEYVYPVNRDFFAGKLGLDAGCGMGRHIYYAAEFGADMVGIDLSSAIDATYQNVKENPRIDLVQCDIYNLPFKPNTFDFVYSIGVLHHLPNPEKGFGRLVDATRTSVFIWVYSKTRVILNFLLEGTRRITVRIPHGLLRKICFFLAGTEWLFFIKPYNLARKAVPRLAWAIDAVTPARIKLYARHPFFVCHTDWFDRLAAPIRFYYDGDDLTGWAARANLKNVSISPTGLYGWRLYGEKT
jgi:SAM-dependent methyltransferase